VKAFAYVNAANEKEAVAALASGGMDARTAGPDRKYLPLAGGMDLLARMKEYTHQPDVLVNVKNLDATIRQTPDGGLRIGSAVKLIDVIENDLIAKSYPAFHYAAAEVGTPQIRHLGTVGGNLNQRPRCWYFRNEEFHCLKKGGARCFSVDGENQFHAIFGEGPCHIVHPSSLAVPSIAYGARFRVVGPSGEREVAAEDYFVMPDRSLFSENVLAPDELLTHVMLPAPRNLRSASYEVRFKPSHDWPIAMATAVLTMNGATVQTSRIVMGAVAPIPWRAPAAEAALVGRQMTEAVAAAAAEAALKGAKPMSGNAYKVQVAKTAVKRALLQAAGIRTV
jgi:xanthine dehydrogenase YagS FAD-binding subunit